MTAIPNDVARRNPANTVPQRQQPKMIDGEVVTRPLHLWRVAGWIAAVIGVVLFAGFLLSMLQQAA